MVAMNTESLPVVALIAGPTASGKSALAMALADLTPSVIINADSMQVYRDLRVVTARPAEADEARHPHRLFGHIDGADACSSARWAMDAKVAVEDAHAAQRLSILVGGTGLYLRTLLDGIAPVPDIDPIVRAEVRALPVAEAYAALMHADPDAAARLAPADTTRVARALEVIRSTGHSLAHWQENKVGGIGWQIRLVPLVLLPPRDWLFARCDARFETMIETGKDEIATLVGRRLDPMMPVMRAIGVPEIAALLSGNLDIAAVKAAGALATRQYAKRQYTWFTNQAPIDWHRKVTQLDSDIVDQLAIMLRDKALTA
jgi:tRNA dimethylallyltransferase